MGKLLHQLLLLLLCYGTLARAACTVNSKLVNSCKPWLGAAANDYPGHSGTSIRDRITDHETRIGRQLDLVHDYSNPGSVLNTNQIYYALRPNTTLLLNYKPSLSWAAASGGNASVNAQIDAMANSIKAIAPKKIILIIFHEPENDVTPGTLACTNLKGNAGSPADYVNMWHNTRARFDRLSVSNVVWGMNYMLYNGGGTCFVKPLWPGNSYVDWVFADPYISDTNTYMHRMDYVYNYFSNNSDATHDFNSKPWGLAEWGCHGMSQSLAYNIYDDARAALIANRYPNFKAHVIFDEGFGPGDGGSRVGAADDTTPDPVEQQHYNAFANDPRFFDSFYTPRPVTYRYLIPRNYPAYALTASSATVGATIIRSAYNSTTGPTSLQRWEYNPATGYISLRDYPKLVLGVPGSVQNILDTEYSQSYVAALVNSTVQTQNSHKYTQETYNNYLVFRNQRFVHEVIAVPLNDTSKVWNEREGVNAFRQHFLFQNFTTSSPSS